MLTEPAHRLGLAGLASPPQHEGFAVGLLAAPSQQDCVDAAGQVHPGINTLVFCVNLW